MTIFIQRLSANAHTSRGEPQPQSTRRTQRNTFKKTTTCSKGLADKGILRLAPLAQNASSQNEKSSRILSSSASFSS